jgi:subtilisin-like proprotein convertase family protein
MKANRRTAVLTMLLFVLMLVAGSYPALAGETVPEEETARLVKEADEAYQNGNFRLAIEKYQKAMQLIGEKKELAQTKQELFQTMTSLALTYFTIQENVKAEKQLQDLIRVNPNQELDPEYYPPKFLEIFHAVQKNFLGKLTVASTPSGATVTLGPSKLGTTPLTTEKVLKGKYELKVELEGYAPVSKEIIIQAAIDNNEELEMEALKPVVAEKAQPVPAKGKKKKKLSPLVIVGGVAVAAAVAVLALGKKSTKKTLTSLTFTQNLAMPIDKILPSIMLLDVQGVPAKIEKVDFRVVINHTGHMEDLVVNIVGTDNQTMRMIWNREQSSVSPQVMSGTSTDFNALAPNGIWRLLVQNPGRNIGGEIREFTLRIYFYQ